MTNLTTVYIRLAFKKGSDNIHVGFTQLGNKTLTGEIMASDDLIVNHQMSFTNLSGESAIGKVATVCIASDEEADALINKIDAIQAARPVNARGNKFPFCWLELATEGTIIFNRGLNGGVDRLTFLDVELVEVHADAPDAVVQIEKPVVSVPAASSPRRGASIEDASAASRYGTQDYRAVRKLRAQNSIAQASANIANSSTLGEASSQVAPSFNTNVIEAVHSSQKDAPRVGQSIDSQDSSNSQQDKLNAIAVAMKAAGMSSAEIAQALKAELELVF